MAERWSKRVKRHRYRASEDCALNLVMRERSGDGFRLRWDDDVGGKRTGGSRIDIPEKQTLQIASATGITVICNAALSNYSPLFYSWRRRAINGLSA
ncbi:hypothetical protein M529_16350 [Sphingobium ummariense RL-3]|uniref:Uncharacterized protein n=1 Tax=Sphingobium ummariense RL-3 TaxID=1346791 RepID=T0KC73_9SPHN|nr:hypothetical protein M529_16350 [Sphingobium ummariense RL-3]